MSPRTSAHKEDFIDGFRCAFPLAQQDRKEDAKARGSKEHKDCDYVEVQIVVAEGSVAVIGRSRAGISRSGWSRQRCDLQRKQRAHSVYKIVKKLYVKAWTGREELPSVCDPESRGVKRFGLASGHGRKWAHRGLSTEAAHPCLRAMLRACYYCGELSNISSRAIFRHRMTGTVSCDQRYDAYISI